jgi:serine/threonine protein kinase
MTRESRPIAVKMSANEPHCIVNNGEVIASTFRIIADIAETETGMVFEAIDMILDRHVAIKIAGRGQPGGVILAEARRCSSVHDQSAVLVHAIGNHMGCEFAVAERVIGRPLYDTLGSAALSPSIYLRRLRQLAVGVAAAHEAGVAILQLASQSILQTDNGRLVIGRLAMSQVATFGQPGSGLAPEIATGAVQPLDPHAAEAIDLYQLGCIAIELASGHPPFSGSPDELLRAHAYDSPPVLAELRPDLPVELSDLVAWLLHKHPATRPRSAADVLAQIDVVIERTRPPRPALRVLIIDEDASRSRWLINLVRRADANAIVEIAGDGRVAAHKLHRDSPDLVLIDSSYNGAMNALELAMYIRGLDNGSRIYIALIGNVADNDHTILQTSHTIIVPNDADCADTLIDLTRIRSSQAGFLPRGKRHTVSG